MANIKGGAVLDVEQEIPQNARRRKQKKEVKFFDLERHAISDSTSAINGGSAKMADSSNTYDQSTSNVEQVFETIFSSKSIPNSFLYRVVKRSLDIIVSTIMLILGLIPGLLLSILITIDTKGSPIYTQTRVGANGRVFKIHKFRTMVADSDNVVKHLNLEQLDQWQKERKVENDPRITKLGKILRRTSMDEFANFIDVFLGHLSIIGPRPITNDELNWFTYDEQQILLAVKPGITGWWQVNARNAATFESGERQKLELFYSRNASISIDFEVFGRTFGSIFGGKGR